MVGTREAENKRAPGVAAAAVGLAAYFVLFLATRLPSIEDRFAGEGGRPVVRRIDLVVQWALRPDELLLPSWFGSPPGLAILDRLPVLLLAAAMLACAAAAGWLAMRSLGADRGLRSLETLCFATGVGTSLVSTFTLCAGLAGWLHYAAVFVIPGLGVAAAAGWMLWRGRAGEGPPAEDGKRDAPERGAAWLLWLAVPPAAVIVLGAMLPPVDFDVREYHLQVPKEWYLAGRIGFLPHNVYGNMPLGAEMLALAAMAVSGDWWLGALAGKTAMGAMTLVTAGAVFCLGRRLFSTRAGAIAALVYLSTPWIVLVSTSGLVEGVTACYAVLAVLAVFLWRDDRSRGRLLLAGYLAGAAAGTKYPALLFVVAPLAIWVVAIAARERVGRAWKPIGVFLLAAVAGGGLWYAKNAALAGNPTYPLLYGVFGGRTWTPEKDAQWSRVHRPHDFSPARLAEDLSKVAWRSEWLSPLLVPLAALAVVAEALRRSPCGKMLGRKHPEPGGRRPDVLILLALFGFVVAAWWLLTHRIDRFWLPALPLLAVLAGRGACWSDHGAWRAVLLSAIGLGLVANLLFSTGGPGGYNRYFVPLEQLRSAPERVDAWHLWLNERAPDGRVLLVGDAEPFDLAMPVLYNTCFDDCVLEQIAEGREPKQVQAALAERGITHVFVHWGEIARYRLPGNYGFTDFVQPAVFDALQQAGVLDPLPAIEGHPGRMYRVRR